MHELVLRALAHARQHVACDAAREPIFDDYRKALLGQPLPSAADLAWFGEQLQLGVLIQQRVQEAVIRGLQWADQARDVTGHRPKVRLSASLDGSLDISMASQDLEPMVWDMQGCPLNTLLHLRSDEFVEAAHARHEAEHWAVQQARFQACGVLSTGLTHLVAALRCACFVELEAWPVYHHCDGGLELTLSGVLRRAGLWFREQATDLQSRSNRATQELERALERIGLQDLSQWLALVEQAKAKNVDVRELVRAKGKPSTTQTQLRAVTDAMQRCTRASELLQSSDLASRELRQLAKGPLPDT